MKDLNYSRIGQIVFALPFVVFGLFHLMQAGNMAQMVLSNWPAATVLVIISGLGLLAAGIANLINKFALLANLLLALELVIFILAIHIPGLGAEDAMMKQIATTGLLKDLALAGGAIVLAGLSKK